MREHYAGCTRIGLESFGPIALDLSHGLCCGSDTKGFDEDAFPPALPRTGFLLERYLSHMKNL
jgi:hypothetical protein